MPGEGAEKKETDIMTFETISAREMDRYVNRRGYLLLDLRSPGEYAAGHMRGARSLPYDNIGPGIRLQRDLIYILYCERGASSLLAARKLAAMGYRVKSVVGGLHAYRGTNFLAG